MASLKQITIDKLSVIRRVSNKAEVKLSNMALEKTLNFKCAYSFIRANGFFHA